MIVTQEVVAMLDGRVYPQTTMDASASEQQASILDLMTQLRKAYAAWRVKKIAEYVEKHDVRVVRRRESDLDY